MKNQGLGLEVPYLVGAEPHRYLPDFVVLIDDGQPDPLNLIIEIKGFRNENAKDKKRAMETYLDSRREPREQVWALGVRRVHRRVRDPIRL